MEKIIEKTKVLIVEDEVVVAKDIEETLVNFGYTIAGTASSATEAVMLAEVHTPQIVLMDIMLDGEFDTAQAAEIIRKRFNIPVVFLTAYSDEKTLEKAKATKPYGFILKTFQETELYTTIEISIHKHKTQRKLIEETENALAAIIGSTEVLLEQGAPSDNTDVLRRIDSIHNAALIIKDTIEKL